MSPYQTAKQRYADLGVDTESALAQLATIPISLHCWQGDDVGGFETTSTELSGGIAVTGNHPGKARNPEELRSDLDKVYSILPGNHRLNLHSFYGEFGGKVVDRDEYEVCHFQNWIDWAKANNHGLDFNPTFFAHPKADSGFTLSSGDKGIRDFWIEHGKRCREIGEAMGQALNSHCANNVWVPDGYKDLPADRLSPRKRLESALDELFSKPMEHNLDAVECKLFGIGSESYVVGSHEFYMGYAVKNQTLLCLDAGHFHPTESIADKLSSVSLHVPEILLHVSRGVRWDSDHVIVLDDLLLDIARELVRGGLLDKTHIGLDFFDASINRVAAWTIGTRAMIKALLIALLEPTETLQNLENEGDYTGRLALMEDLKMMPFGDVWEEYCERQNVPGSHAWLNEVRDYENTILAQRESSQPTKIAAA
ncbi:L-rhamnose isomerase [Roseibacillus persicicus]|uniref:L-rhamnose isomerase n=1 Tax=Roseibacillus persicicus TaxID=454148 RepID=UPI00398A9527